MLTEAVSVATARINQSYYTGNAIGFASGKLPLLILNGELLVVNQGNGMESLYEFQIRNSEKYGEENQGQIIQS